MKRRRGLTVLEGIFAAVLLLVLAAILIPPCCFHGHGGAKIACLSNLKQQAVALILYASNNNDRLPERDYWMTVSSEYAKHESIFRCTGLLAEDPDRKAEYGYAFNSRLSGVSLLKLREAEKVPMVYDSMNLAKNASDPYVSLPSPPRKHKTTSSNQVVYADGHAKTLRTLNNDR